MVSPALDRNQNFPFFPIPSIQVFKTLVFPFQVSPCAACSDQSAVSAAVREGRCLGAYQTEREEGGGSDAPLVSRERCALGAHTLTESVVAGIVGET